MKTKNILWLLVVLLLSAACGIEQLPDTAASSETNDDKDGQAFTITAGIGMPDTRIVYTADGKATPGMIAQWEPDDKLGLLYCNYEKVDSYVGDDGYWTDGTRYIPATFTPDNIVLALTNTNKEVSNQATFVTQLPESTLPEGFIFYYPVVEQLESDTEPVKFSLLGQKVTIGTDGEIASHTLSDYNLMTSFPFQEYVKDYSAEKPDGSLITFPDGTVSMKHLCALIVFDLPSIGAAVKRIELRSIQQYSLGGDISFGFATEIGLGQLLVRNHGESNRIGIDVTDLRTDYSGRIKGCMMVNYNPKLVRNIGIQVIDEFGGVWRSNVHLTSGTLKNGKTYTFKTKLSPPKFAASNIYWDGEKLTFDTDDQLELTGTSISAHNDKSVFFKWGSLIGISSEGDEGDPITGDTKVYKPIHSQPGQYEEMTLSASFGQYDLIPSFASETFEANYGTENALLYKWGADHNYWSDNGKTSLHEYQGDICAFITNGAWRMPTEVEFANSGDFSFGNDSFVNGHLEAEGNIYMKFDDETWSQAHLPALGLINEEAFLQSVDEGFYWSASVTPANSQLSYQFYFDTDSYEIDAKDTDARKMAYPVRCIRNIDANNDND
jgi:uncharacterized protein (TIGR02145 family)